MIDNIINVWDTELTHKKLIVVELIKRQGKRMRVKGKGLICSFMLAALIIIAAGCGNSEEKDSKPSKDETGITDATGGRKEKTYFGSDEVSDIPKQVTVKKTKQPKEEFYVTERQAASFPYSEKYLATEIAVKLTETADTEKVKKLTGADIFRYVKANGWADEVYIERRRTRVVYDSGLEKGIFLDKRVSAKGKEYEDIYYSEKAQKIIVEHYVKDDVG